MGDSLIYHAGRWATSVRRKNLNLDHLNVTVRWLGMSKMQWHQFQSKIQWIGLHNPPKIIIVHLGGNDVVSTKMQKMKRLMERDFKDLFKTFPGTIIVWSEILPRLVWKFAPLDSDWRCWNRKRIRFNQLGRQMVSKHTNGKVIKHDVTVDCPGLFYKDGCHMSDVGNALFCNSLQGGIETFLTTEIKTFAP